MSRGLVFMAYVESINERIYFQIFNFDLIWVTLGLTRVVSLHQHPWVSVGS